MTQTLFDGAVHPTMMAKATPFSMPTAVSRHTVRITLAELSSRVARARNLPESQIAAVVTQYTEARLWGFIGEPRVNVLELNLALDQLGSG